MNDMRKIFLTVSSSSCWNMRYVRTAIQIRSAIFTNCSSWIRQNLQQSQIICHSKNSTASQSKQHDIHFIFIYEMKHMTSHIHSVSVYWMKHVISQLPEHSCLHSFICSLISFAVWYYLQFDIVSEFDIICSLILWAVWYCLHSFILFSYLISILSHYSLIALSFNSFMC